MEEIIRFSVSLPKNLLYILDEKIASQGYASRSEFTRDLIREKIVKDSWKDKDNELIGVVVAIYNHHQTDLVAKKIAIEHDSNVEVICTTHVHIDHHNCLETSVIKGKGNLIENFANSIAGLKGVKFMKLTRAAVTQN